MNTTATAMMTLSREASEVDSAARSYVDYVNRRHYDDRMPSDVATTVYRAKVMSTVHERMMEELAPIRKAIMKTTLMFLEPKPEVPKELREMQDAVEKRWASVYDEFLRRGG